VAHPPGDRPGAWPGGSTRRFVSFDPAQHGVLMRRHIGRVHRYGPTNRPHSVAPRAPLRRDMPSRARRRCQIQVVCHGPNTAGTFGPHQPAPIPADYRLHHRPRIRNGRPACPSTPATDPRRAPAARRTTAGTAPCQPNDQPFVRHALVASRGRGRWLEPETSGVVAVPPQASGPTRRSRARTNGIQSRANAVRPGVMSRLGSCAGGSVGLGGHNAIDGPTIDQHPGQCSEQPAVVCPGFSGGRLLDSCATRS
jgi:hypothetical protein